MKEHRRFKRWDINRKTKIKLEGAQNFASCTINDLSFMGAKVTLTFKLTRDKFLKLRLVLSRNLWLDVEAWVVWDRAVDGLHCYGLYFSKIKDSDKEKIYQFIWKNYPHKLNGQWWSGIKREGGEKMENGKFEDHRIFERFTAKFPINFIDLIGNKEGEGAIEDVSAKGVGFSCKEELPPRTPLEMWLKIPDKSGPLYTRGEVVWSKMIEPNNCRIGVNLEKADLMGLSRVLRLA